MTPRPEGISAQVESFERQVCLSVFFGCPCGASQGSFLWNSLRSLAIATICSEVSVQGTAFGSGID